MCKNDLKSLVYETASKSEMGKKVGCALVHRNRVIATGCNRYDKKYSLTKQCLL